MFTEDVLILNVDINSVTDFVKPILHKLLV